MVCRAKYQLIGVYISPAYIVHCGLLDGIGESYVTMRIDWEAFGLSMF